jgi:hypothetical protein
MPSFLACWLRWDLGNFLPRLASNHNLISASQVVGITSMYHHAQLLLLKIYSTSSLSVRDLKINIESLLFEKPYVGSCRYSSDYGITS